MWTVQRVAKERAEYIIEPIVPTPHKEKYMCEIKNMTETTGITDDRLKQYIFNLNLDDKETAFLLDYADVPTDNALQSILRVILGFILAFYCLPVSVPYFILRSTTGFRFEYKKKGAVPLSELFVLVLLCSILSTLFYLFFYPLFSSNGEI